MYVRRRRPDKWGWWRQISVNAFRWPDSTLARCYGVAQVRDDSRRTGGGTSPVKLDVWPRLNLENPSSVYPWLSSSPGWPSKSGEKRLVESLIATTYFCTLVIGRAEIIEFGYRYSSVFFREKRSRSRMKLKGAVWSNGFLVGVDGRTIFRDRYWIFSLPSPGNGIGNWLYRQATTRSPPIIYSW